MLYGRQFPSGMAPVRAYIKFAFCLALNIFFLIFDMKKIINEPSEFCCVTLAGIGGDKSPATSGFRK